MKFIYILFNFIRFRFYKISAVSFIICVLICTVSCGSFSKNSNYHALTQEMITELEGKYLIKEEEDSTDSRSYIKDFGDYFNYGLWKPEFDFDTSEITFFELDFINEKNVKIRLLNNLGTIYEIESKYKLKKDGFIHLMYKRLYFFGLPYLAGRFNFKKIRMTIGSNKDLYVEGVEYDSGAVLFIIELNSSINKSKSQFKRIK